MPVAQKGAISFALVYIPVELYTATQDNAIRFNQLAKESKGRVRYKKVDEKTGKELKNDDIVKGYEYEKGKYVVVTDDEFEKIKTEKDRSIQIMQFADQQEICPVYYNKTYYVVPQKGGEKPFELLRRAMQETDKVAVGQTVVGSTEAMLALIPADTGICMHTLYYEDEVREVPRDFAKPAIAKAELDMADKIVSSMAKPFDPEQFHNEYQRRLKEMIGNKVEGREVTAPQEKSGGTVLSLMDALKASVDGLDTGGKAKGRAAKTPRARKTGS